MAAIPHVGFSATVPEDAEFSHPPGTILARQLKARLRDVADDIAPFDYWHDRGWIVTVSINDRRFESYFARLTDSRWLHAVAPVDRPGLLGKLVGRKADDASAELRRLCDSIHGLLARSPLILELFWKFGAPPYRKSGVSSPDIPSFCPSWPS